MKQTFRHSFTSRFLFSGISSHLYYQDWTVDDLLGELAKQAIDAYEVGVLEPWIECSKKRSGIPTTGKYSKFSIHTTNICIVLYVIFYVIWSMSNNYIYMVIYYIYMAWTQPTKVTRVVPLLLHQDIGSTKLRLVNVGTKGDWVFLRKVPYLIWWSRFFILPNTYNIIHSRGHYHTQSQVYGNGYVEFLGPSIIPLPFKSFIFKIVYTINYFLG